MTYTYGAEPESICHVNQYNRKGPAVTTNALDCLKDLLDAFAIAGSFNRELISQLTFHSNKYACGKEDDSKGVFVGYKCTNVSIAEMYQFIRILLKMSLISLDVNGFKSLWYLPSHAMIAPTCQFKIKDYPSWTKQYMSYSYFFK